MSRFSDVLRPLASRLDLPQPTRSRVLLELAADLEDLYELSRARGMDEEEARRSATERVVPSEQALEALVRLHASPYRRLLDRLGGGTNSRGERIASMTLLLFVASATGPLLFSSDFFRHAGAIAVPVVLITLAALLVGASRFYRLELRQDHRPRGLRSGLGPLLGLAGANVLLGGTAANLDFYRTARRAAETSEPLLRLVLDVGIRCSAMLVLALLGGIVTALIWFLLARRVARIERAEAELLLEL